MKIIFLDIDGVLKDVPNHQLSIGGWEISINTKTAVIPPKSLRFLHFHHSPKKLQRKNQIFLTKPVKPFFQGV